MLNRASKIGVLMYIPPLTLLLCLQFENSNEIGVFAKLTNAYCLVALGGSENFYRYSNLVRPQCNAEMAVKQISTFYFGRVSTHWAIGLYVMASGCMLCSVFQAELAEHIPVIKTSIAGTRLVGRMTVGK
jgi:translation initiation factor 6